MEGLSYWFGFLTTIGLNMYVYSTYIGVLDSEFGGASFQLK